MCGASINNWRNPSSWRSLMSVATNAQCSRRWWVSPKRTTLCSARRPSTPTGMEELSKTAPSRSTTADNSSAVTSAAAEQPAKAVTTIAVTDAVVVLQELPEWIGAESIWSGASGFAANQGEGVVVGVIDSGIDWDHDSFQDPSPAPDFYDHENPFGQQIGLCSDAEVLCNDKLIGVWDFTDEESKGRDTASPGHGTLVSSIAVGNRHTVGLVLGTGGQLFTLKGVAPRANLVSYKVCREDDPATEEDEKACPGTAIVQAVNQAIEDEVDVVNFSIGSGPADPWVGYAALFLDLREVGIFAVTSNGNEGPAAGSAGYPAVAPWVMGAGAASHSRVIGAILSDMTGGSSVPPENFIGTGKAPVNGSANGYGPVDIVFAGDFGNALCGQGTAELQSSCNAHTGSTNPFAPGTFNGEIVVCERGRYGRIEKSFNVMEAGAGGYILINDEINGNATNEDAYCIPGIHLTHGDGLELKAWLDSGSGHLAGIGAFDLFYDEGIADRIADLAVVGPMQVLRMYSSPILLHPAYPYSVPMVLIHISGQTGLRFHHRW